MKTIATNFFIVTFSLLTIMGGYGLMLTASIALIESYGQLTGVILSILSGVTIVGILFVLFIKAMDLIFD